MYDLPDNRFDNVDLLDVIKIIEEEIRIYEPDIVFCHHPKDLNVDHRVSGEAVITATRPMPESLAPNVLAFETLSSTEWQMPEQDFGFQPNFSLRSLTKTFLRSSKLWKITTQRLENIRIHAQ